MTVVKYEALKSLECHISDAILDLKGNICSGVGVAGHKLHFPSLALDVARWRFKPYPDAFTKRVSPSKVVMNVGKHEAILQMRLHAATSYERYELADKISALFLQRENAPGNLLLDIASQDYGDVMVAYDLSSEEWEDEKAFDQKYAAVIEVNITAPALVTRCGVYSIADLRIALGTSIGNGANPDIDASQLNVFPEPIADRNANIEVISINQNGTISIV